MTFLAAPLLRSDGHHVAGHVPPVGTWEGFMTIVSRIPNSAVRRKEAQPEIPGAGLQI
jgi:hypothetical protein